jgi:hypothetical protein
VTNKYLKCYFCDFSTDIDSEYQKHVERNHPSKPVYPTIRQIQELGLKPQDKIWESLGLERIGLNQFSTIQ